MAPGNDVDTEPAGAGRVSRGKLRACALCKSKKKRCTHMSGDHAVVTYTDIIMNTRLRKQEQAEAATSKAKSTKSPSSTASTSSTTSTNKMEKTSRRHKRSVSVKTKKSDPEPTTPTKTTEAVKPETAASKATMPEPPTGTLEGSITMGVHSVFAHELQRRLDEFEAKFEASVAAHQATQEAAQAVRNAVHGWVDAWTDGR